VTRWLSLLFYVYVHSVRHTGPYRRQSRSSNFLGSNSTIGELHPFGVVDDGLLCRQLLLDFASNVSRAFALLDFLTSAVLICISLTLGTEHWVRDVGGELRDRIRYEPSILVGHRWRIEILFAIYLFRFQ